MGLGHFGEWAVSEAVGVAQNVGQSSVGRPGDLHLPVTLFYPMGGIVGRAALGLAAVAIAAALIYVGGLIANMLAFGFLLLGGVTLAGNLLALADPKRRAIHLSADAIAVRYGLSQRSYRFIDYADFRIGRVGGRDMLTALPLEVDVPVGEQHGSASVLLKPAVISPMPPFGGAAPDSLAAWETLLKDMRRAAVAGQKAAKIRLVDRTVA